MKKQQAIGLFGDARKTAEAVGVTTSAVYQWSDPIPQRIADRVIAAAVRRGKKIPKSMLAEVP